MIRLADQIEKCDRLLTVSLPSTVVTKLRETEKNFNLIADNIRSGTNSLILLT